MASLFLIRHAQASFGTDDYDRLSAVGLEQARMAGEFLGAVAGPRVRAVTRDIALRSARGTTTVAVNSGALIAATTLHVLGLPDGSAYGLFEAMKSCSITHLLHSAERISLSSFHDTTYLTALGLSRGPTRLITYR